MHINQIISNLMNAKGYNALYVANIMNANEDTINNWLTGKLKMTDNDIVKFLSLGDVNMQNYKGCYNSKKITWNIREIVRKICIQKNIAITKLSAKLGYNPAYLHSYCAPEHCKTPINVPKYKLICELSKFSGIPVKDFYKDPVAKNDIKAEKQLEIQTAKQEIAKEPVNIPTKQDKDILTILHINKDIDEKLVKFCEEKGFIKERFLKSCIKYIIDVINQYAEGLDDNQEYYMDIKDDIINEYHNL